jgi:hypothetical protein
MAINRRRAASSEISSSKKKDGHKYEDVYSKLIEGTVIKGTKKGDVIDQLDFQYSVKSGKKWQIFLYGHDRISSSKYLRILKPSLEAFPANSEIYFRDRIRCIEFKEAYVKKHGKEKAKKLSNQEVTENIGQNEYVDSKTKLAKATAEVSRLLQDQVFLRKFLAEALFNNDEVSYLAIRDSTYKKDNIFKTFDRDDVLDILTRSLVPAISNAGYAPQDFNVPGQKTLLKYNKNGTIKNIVEIEIRNDSETHYRQVRFNMYSEDALFLLTEGLKDSAKVSPVKGLEYYGKARSYSSS